MAPLKLPPVTVVSAKNKNNGLITNHSKRSRKGIPRKIYNVYINTIVVDYIIK